MGRCEDPDASREVLPAQCRLFPYHLFDKLRRVPVGRAQNGSREQLPAQIAECAKEVGSNECGAAKTGRPNGAALDGDQRVDDFISCFKEKSRQAHESDSSFRWPNAPAPGSSKELNRGIFLKLPGLNAKVRLSRMQYFRSCSYPLFLKDGEQIAEMAKFGPIVHSPVLGEVGFRRSGLQSWKKQTAFCSCVSKSWQAFSF